MVLNLAELDRAYSKHFLNDPAFSERFNDPHNPTTEFIFHDLLEHLLLVSHHIYGNTPNLPVFEKGLAGSFSYFLKTHILDHVTFKADPITIHDDQCFTMFQDFEETYKSEMNHLFNSLSHKTGKSLKNSIKDNTFTFREFALMLKVLFIL